MINEEILLDLIFYHLRKVLNFNPYKSYPHVTNRTEFQELIAQDPAFGVLGLEDERYVIARVGGNLVTSLHRKIGDMYEALFQYLLQESFNLDPNELHFSVEVKIGDRFQTRSTDGLLRKRYFTENIPSHWQDYDGVGFELRSCYQIGDSKRIQADYDMSLALKANKIYPVMLIFCNTSLRSPLSRLSKSWEVYEGRETFNLIYEITGFDLYQFLQQKSEIIRQEIDNIFSSF